ncbi:protein-lysine N-methyltransferase EEF2KMT [Rhynchophorus ferrugineus]|uniref:protein-lysine N-methyltransferase EEF2KMT n=1 Tax=Rhynchophorus ferrugineus TaxID=354439 RepID=UPI003FCDF45A
MKDIIHVIRKQFLCGVPLVEFNFHCNIEYLSLDEQKLLLDQTVNDELVVKYPIRIEYQKVFIKHLLRTLENKGCEVHDDIYSVYGRLVALTYNSDCFKHYIIDSTKGIIILKENNCLISEGTTGLRTWQASLALSEWALKNKHFVEDKTVLELGSGIGLTGLTVTLKCNPKKYFFSDCHNSVLTTLCENIFLNTSNQSVNIDLNELITLHLELTNKTEISVLKLPWEEVDEDLSLKLGEIDIILAADVVYDNELFKPLLQALRIISKYCKSKQIILACTERNTSTLEEFLTLGGNLFLINQEECPTQNNFIWCNDPQVRFFRLNLI